MRTYFAAAACLICGMGCGPRPVSTGPFMTFVALERWHRAAPAAEHTMAGIATFHVDGRLPYWKVLDEHCGMGFGNWPETTERPPSYGPITMDIAGRQQVTWREDEYNLSDYEAPDGGLVWDSGDRLHVTAQGAALPAFDIEVTVPDQVELTSHDLRSLAEGELHVSRAQGLELRWSPTQGDVELSILQFPRDRSAEQKRSMWCVWPAAPGSVTVSPEILGNLLPTTGNLVTNIYFGGGNRLTRDLGGTLLEVYTWKNEVARITVE